MQQRSLILAIAATVGLTACQSTVMDQTASRNSAIASASATNNQVTVVTARGNRHTFTAQEVCGHTWMQVGDERFTLGVRGNRVTVDGYAINGLICPTQGGGGGGGGWPTESVDESQSHSGSLDTGESVGAPGTDPATGGGSGFSAISG